MLASHPTGVLVGQPQVVADESFDGFPAIPERLLELLPGLPECYLINKVGILRLLGRVERGAFSVVYLDRAGHDDRAWQRGRQREPGAME